MSINEHPILWFLSGRSALIRYENPRQNGASRTRIRSILPLQKPSAVVLFTNTTVQSPTAQPPPPCVTQGADAPLSWRASAFLTALRKDVACQKGSLSALGSRPCSRRRIGKTLTRRGRAEQVCI